MTVNVLGQPKSGLVANFDDHVAARDTRPDWNRPPTAMRAPTPATETDTRVVSV